MIDTLTSDLVDTATITAPLISMPTELNIDLSFESLGKYIYTGLLIIAAFVLIIYRLWSWHKEAKADGKVEKKEIEEAINIIKEGAEEIATIVGTKEGESISILKDEKPQNKSKYRKD